MAHLVQILLPRNDQAHPLPNKLFEQVRVELTRKFGGVTVYSRSVAEGLWSPSADVFVHDEMVLFEVMTDVMQPDWWRAYRRELEQRFEQIEVVVRDHEITRF